MHFAYSKIKCKWNNTVHSFLSLISFVQLSFWNFNIVTYTDSSLHFIAEWYFVVWISNNFCSEFIFDGPLCCFQLEAIMKTFLHKFCVGMLSFHLWNYEYLRDHFFSYMVRYVWFYKKWPRFQNDCYMYIPSNCRKYGTSLPTLNTFFLIIIILIVDISMWFQWESVEIFIYFHLYSVNMLNCVGWFSNGESTLYSWDKLLLIYYPFYILLYLIY